jgi:mono/diheme cytochrome c family protein
MKYIFAIILFISLNSCKKSNFEEIHPPNINQDTTKATSSCDTINVSYSGSISKIFNNNCNSCHSSAAGNFPPLDSIQPIKDNIETIINSIMQNGLASPMPKGSSKLDDCTINKIKAWKNKGFPQ